MASRLEGKSIMITGAAQGIGEAIARACLGEGASLFLVDTDGAKLEAMAATLSAPQARLVAAIADITDPPGIAEALARANLTIQPINALINNAGINVFRDPLTMTDADWELCLSVDLKGAWNCTRAVLPQFLELGEGTVLNIASTHSFTIIPGTFPYPVAKHGLIGLTRALGLEYASRNIRMNALAPGYVETQKVIDYWAGFADPIGAKAKTLALHPGGRIATPHEIAMAALFLISDECPFINATCLTADGGLSVLHHPNGDLSGA